MGKKKTISDKNDVRPPARPSPKGKNDYFSSITLRTLEAPVHSTWLPLSPLQPRLSLYFFKKKFFSNKR